MLEQGSPEQPTADSGSLSLEQRIENKFGGGPQELPPDEPQEEVEATGEAPEQEAEPTEETFELQDDDGAKYVLPKKLEKKFLQERDYTQKSQQLAEQRRAVEIQQQQFKQLELRQKFNENVAGEIKQLQMIDAVLEQPVNWQAMSTDEAFRHKIQLDDLRSQRDKLTQTVQAKYGEFQQQSQKQAQELQAKTLEALRQKVPNWDDKLAAQVTNHMREQGFTDADFESFNTHPKYVLAAWKAMQYDQLQAKATATVQQAKTVKSTSSKPMPQQTKELLNYRKALSKAPQNSPERKRLLESRAASIFSR